MSIELKDVLMPELQGADEITVGAWSKQRGDHVAEGETLMEAHTDKVNAEIPSPFSSSWSTFPLNGEIPSPFSGKVDQLLLNVGDPVKPGQPIARISPE
jgi:2-oxoglutarate dehydrogenase E2 component (dihydrolipoamide succinyltransferase)